MSDDLFLALEAEVMGRLLAGDHPVLERLRQQHAQSHVERREFTAAGFYSHFVLDKAALPRATQFERLRLGDVVASLQGLGHGAGFVLFINGGYLDFLEGYTFDEPWPARIEGFDTTYQNGAVRRIEELSLFS